MRGNPIAGMALALVLALFFWFSLWALTDGSLWWLGGVAGVSILYVTAEFIASKRKESDRESTPT